MSLAFLPYYFNGLPLLNTEVKWMVIGEALGDGQTMYKDVWDNTAPLSAGMYWLCHTLFGARVTGMRLLAFMFVFFQAVNFNVLVNGRGLYKEKTFVPGLLYAFTCWVSFGFFSLSPVLLALFPLHLLLRNLFKVDHLDSDENVFSMGFYIGLAALFFYPFCHILAFCMGIVCFF
jgi:hypothetical protein